MKVYRRRRHTLEPLRYNIFGGWFIVFNFWSNQLLPFKLNRHAQILCMPCKCVLANCLVFFCVNCLADAWHNQMEWYRMDRIGMRKIDFIWNGTLLEANSRYKFKWDVQNVPFEFQSKWEFNNPLREIRYTICTAHTDTAIQFSAPIFPFVCSFQFFSLFYALFCSFISVPHYTLRGCHGDLLWLVLLLPLFAFRQTNNTHALSENQAESNTR